MFVALSKFKVVNGMAQEVAKAFRDRPHLVDGVTGFQRMEVMTPCDDSTEFWLMTWWEDQVSFETWHHSKEHKASHSGIPKGLKLDPKTTVIQYFDHIAS